MTKKTFNFQNWKITTLLFTVKKLKDFIESLLVQVNFKNKIHFYNMLEPVIGTAMMTSLSLICNLYLTSKNPDTRFKQSILAKLKLYEDNLILHNNQFGVMQSYIRNKGEVPPEALVLFEENHPTDFLKLKTIEVDEHIKILTSTTINKFGEENIMKCIVPAHENLSDYDSFNLELFSNKNLGL
eukprot:gene3179-5495_t